MKGQKSRAGSSARPGFEGGKTSLIEQLPKKRGFRSIKKKAQAVNLDVLEKTFKSGDKVNPKILKSKGLISDVKAPVKILGQGDLKKKLDISVHNYSQTASKKIKKAGGQARFVNEQEQSKESKKKEIKE